MYLLTLCTKMPILSALRFREAALHRDNRLIKLRARGHREVYIRRCAADLDTLDEVMCNEGIYSAALDILPACETYVDLGANIGLASVIVKERFPDCRVLAFEPHPANFKMLSMNAPFAESFQAAAWSQDGHISFVNEAANFNAFAVKEGGSIPAYSMKSIVAMAGGAITFLKMDIEGGEVELFRDPSWLSAVKVLAIEFHGDSRLHCRFDEAIAKYGMRIIHDSKNSTIAATL